MCTYKQSSVIHIERVTMVYRMKHTIIVTIIVTTVNIRVLLIVVEVEFIGGIFSEGGTSKI